MPLPAGLARFNRRVTNPAMRVISSRVPPLATLVHVGRQSGREYRTPVMAFPTDDGFGFALTYGPEVDWVHNVLAASRCQLVYRGEEFALDDAERITGAGGAAVVAAYVRPALRALGVDEFLTMTIATVDDE